VLEKTQNTSSGDVAQPKPAGEDAMEETATLVEMSQSNATNMEVTREIETRCASFMRNILAFSYQLGNDRCAEETCQAIFYDISSCAKVMCSREMQTPYIGRNELLEQNSVLKKELRDTRAERECAENVLRQALCERDKAVDDLNRTRAELAAAFPSGGDIAGTFPIANELQGMYCKLCSQDLFNHAPEELASTVALFKLIFGVSLDQSKQDFEASSAGILGSLAISNESEKSQVEGLVLKAMRLRRSAIFRSPLADIEYWIDCNMDGPLSVVLPPAPSGKAELVKNIQALYQLMGCFQLSQPALRVNLDAIGEEVEFSSKLHKVLDGRIKDRRPCTIVFPPLFQDQDLLCKAFVLPS